MANLYLTTDAVGLSMLELDRNIIDITFPQIDRNYSVEDNYSDGHIINGTGSAKAGPIVFKLIYHKRHLVSGVYTDYNNAFNYFRNMFNRYFGVSKNQNVYLNRIDSDGTIKQQKITPLSKSPETYQYAIDISSEVTYTFQQQESYFYDTIANSTDYTVETSFQELFSVANNGVLPTSPFFTFVPSEGFSSLQIQLYYGNYGFTLASTFYANQPITFNCANSEITVNGNVISGIRSQGARFTIPVGTVQMYITACPGTLTTSFNERYF